MSMNRWEEIGRNVFRGSALSRALKGNTCSSCEELQKKVTELTAALDVQVRANAELGGDLNVVRLQRDAAQNDANAEHGMWLVVKAQNEKLRAKLDLGPNDSF
jgi:hypothetical protein